MQLDRGTQRGQAAVTDRSGVVPVREALGDEIAERNDVELEPVLAEHHGLARDLEPIRVERRLERREGSPERATRPVGPGLRPEPRGERVAAHGAILDGEEREQGRRLTRVDGERPTFDLDERWPQKAERETGGPGHAQSVFATASSRFASS